MYQYEFMNIRLRRNPSDKLLVVIIINVLLLIDLVAKIDCVPETRMMSTVGLKEVLKEE